MSVAPRLKDWAWDGRAGSPACEGFVMTALGVAERIRLSSLYFSQQGIVSTSEVGMLRSVLDSTRGSDSLRESDAAHPCRP
jgi:hypothetical protein